MSSISSSRIFETKHRTVHILLQYILLKLNCTTSQYKKCPDLLSTKAFSFKVFPLFICSIPNMKCGRCYDWFIMNSDKIGTVFMLIILNCEKWNKNFCWCCKYYTFNEFGFIISVLFYSHQAKVRKSKFRWNQYKFIMLCNDDCYSWILHT